MSNSFGALMPNITIAIGTAVSTIISAVGVYEDAIGIGLYGPAALDAHTFVIQVSYDPDATAASTWYDLTDDTGTDIAPPGALLGRAYFNIPMFGAFRIKDETGNVAAERIWKATRLYRNY